MQSLEKIGAFVSRNMALIVVLCAAVALILPFQDKLQNKLHSRSSLLLPQKTLELALSFHTVSLSGHDFSKTQDFSDYELCPVRDSFLNWNILVHEIFV